MTTRKVKTFAELEAVAEAAQMLLCISSSPDLAAFDISDISDGPSLAEWASTVAQNGRLFVGITALTNGTVASHLVEPLEVPAIEMLAAATVSHIARRLNQSLTRLGLAARQQTTQAAN